MNSYTLCLIILLVLLLHPLSKWDEDGDVMNNKSNLIKQNQISRIDRHKIFGKNINLMLSHFIIFEMGMYIQWQQKVKNWVYTIKNMRFIWFIV